MFYIWLSLNVISAEKLDGKLAYLWSGLKSVVNNVKNDLSYEINVND